MPVTFLQLDVFSFFVLYSFLHCPPPPDILVPHRLVACSQCILCASWCCLKCDALRCACFCGGGASQRWDESGRGRLGVTAFVRDLPILDASTFDVEGMIRRRNQSYGWGNVNSSEGSEREKKLMYEWQPRLAHAPLAP